MACWLTWFGRTDEDQQMAEKDDNIVLTRRVRTIADLARIAGVSAGTVSRALADKSLVNPETRRRIQELAREHGFRPNQMASNLRTQRTGVINIVIPLSHDRRQHVSDPFFMTMIGYLADGLTERGYQLMLSRVVPDDDDGWLERIVYSGMSDGAIVIGQSDQFDAIERVAADYRPLVVWGEHRDGQQQCSIGTDNFAGGKLAAEHLLATGRRNLCFLGDARPPEIAARHAGAQAAVTDAGLGPLPVFQTPLAADGMIADINRHFDRLDPAMNGIIAASDVTALNAIRVLADRAIAVPSRIAVVGYDDLPFAAQSVPSLTTVRQDLAAGTDAMIGSLFALMRGEEADSTVLSPTLVVRDSA